VDSIREPERMRRLLALLDEALDKPAADRAAWLDAIAEPDAGIRARLARVLEAEADSRAAALVDAGAVALVGAPPEDEVADRKAGERVGHWVLERPLGRGGMGTVWLARKEGDASLPPAAIKMPTSSVGRGAAERLAREGALLAALNHPGIARLLEVGEAADGLPFLALEYVDGQTLPAWCDARGLSTRERLALFVKVLDAVAYAHSALVLHRDLKPANILVTPTGDVKLLDFGIAKLMDNAGSAASTQLTRLAGRALTPDYASPEQVAGVPLTVASDVYSLGVVLYELVTGARPYRLKRGSAAELEEAILTSETGRPSASVEAAFASRNRETIARLRRQLAGDLDTIILKALKKSPAERYPTVAALQGDIANYLSGLPVAARPDSTSYRALKFVQRHRLGVATAAAIVVSLVAGLAAALWQAEVARENARIAQVERARAEQRFDDIRAIANSLVTEVVETIRFLPGATQARVRIVGKAVEFLDKLSSDPRRDDALTREIAGGYQLVAEALNSALYAHQGDAEGANRSYAKALALMEPLAARPGATVVDRSVYAGVLLSHAVNLLEQGQLEAARDHVRRGMEVRQALLAESPDDIERSRDMGTAETYLANVLIEQGDLEAALATNEAVLARFRAMVERDARSVRNRWGLICGYANTGSVMLDLGRAQEAKPRLRQAVALNQELVKDRPDHYSVIQGFGHYHHMLAQIARRERDAAAARDHLERALAYREGLVRRDASDVEGAMQLARSRALLGLHLAEQGAARQGLALVEAARSALRDVDAKRPGNRRIETAMVEVDGDAARALLAAGRVAQACAIIGDAAARLAALRLRHPSLASISRIALPTCPAGAGPGPPPAAARGM